jgi:hypothetical protein
MSPDQPTAPDSSGQDLLRQRRLDDVTHFSVESAASTSSAPPSVVPWTLQHYFDGEIDLIKELAGRFPQVPLMSLISLRDVGVKNRRSVATISTQDGAASLTAEVDVLSRAVQFTFALNSMLALRFCPGKLSAMDRTQWMEPLRREAGEAAFLWDQARWQSDFLIGAAHKNFTQLFAFSPNHVEAAARLTPDVAHKLLDWLEHAWRDALE